MIDNGLSIEEKSWLKEHLQEFKTPTNRLRYTLLQDSFEKKFGHIPDSAALENLVAAPKSRGWPKGKPRGKKAAASYDRSDTSRTYIKQGVIPAASDVRKINAYVYDGQVLIPLEEAKQIFGKA